MGSRVGARNSTMSIFKLSRIQLCKIKAYQLKRSSLSPRGLCLDSLSKWLDLRGEPSELGRRIGSKSLRVALMTSPPNLLLLNKLKKDRVSTI